MDFSAGLARVTAQIGAAIGIWKSKNDTLDHRDAMLAAAEDYVMDVPFNVFDEEENQPIF